MHKRQHIVICGAECTGKTSLAKQLSAILGGLYVPELARQFVEKHQRRVEVKDVERIAKTVLRRQTFLSQSSKPVIFDTDLLNTIVYAQIYFNYDTRLIERYWQQVCHHYHYVLCDTQLPWQNEPLQRSNRTLQKKCQQKIIELLNQYQVQYDRSKLT